jgi:hypothetical protein
MIVFGFSRMGDGLLVVCELFLADPVFFGWSHFDIQRGIIIRGFCWLKNLILVLLIFLPLLLLRLSRVSPPSSFCIPNSTYVRESIALTFSWRMSSAFGTDNLETNKMRKERSNVEAARLRNKFSISSLQTYKSPTPVYNT